MNSTGKQNNIFMIHPYLLQYWFLAGTLNAASSPPSGTIHFFETYIRHPQYDVGTYDYDVGVVKVKKPFKIGFGVNPVRLATQNMRVIVGEQATVIGWGVTEDGRLSSALLQVKVPLIDQDYCRDKWMPTLVNAR